jgi:hypothetical protein
LDITVEELDQKLEKIEKIDHLPGFKTDNGGEIFNSYDDINNKNQAIGDYTSANGKATRAGLYGYKLIGTEILDMFPNEANVGTHFNITVSGSDAASEYEPGDLLSFDG